MENNTIYQEWLELTQLTETTHTKNCFKEVEKQYTQITRHYHSLDHIQQLFVHIKNVVLSDIEKSILAHVALFHDVIYESHSKENEIKSAQIAVTWLDKLAIPNPVQLQIKEIIIGTATHTSHDPLAQLFFDMDISILGAPKEAYINYYHAIKKEYNTVPDLIYKIGRKQFLKQLLDQDTLFYTKKYQEIYELQARMNIQEELNTL
ncbi:hypothetical protein [uncultured Dokdonia sp.]|uniref:HD domain-containing protein n=1 Tax=uncultured Dokdonia sp. TaxID=575653 RepID=UPI0026128E1B|nr:hypothetical protein [uncultured Dokdonia sp.]